MRSALVSFVIAAFLLADVLSGPTGAAQSRVDSETWFVVKISGVPVGFASETARAEGSNTVFRAHMNLSLSRMGTPLSMFIMVEETIDAHDRFRESRMEMKASTIGSQSHAVLVGDTVVYSFESAGNVRTRKFGWEEDALTQWQVGERLKKWIDGEDPELSYKSFNISDGSFKTVRVVRGASESAEVDGRTQTLRSAQEFQEGVAVGTMWYDEDADVYRNVMLQMGMEIVVERVTAEEMAEIDVDPDFDIIRQSMIPCRGYPDDPEDVEDVTVRLEMARPLSADHDFAAPNQREVGRGPDWVDLKITRQLANELKLDDSARAMYLKPGQYIQSEHRSITAVADSIRKAVGEEPDAIARAAAAWVNGFIVNKNYEQGFASALETMQTRAGDCTEHSVLLTSVLRAAGIPARPSVGLAYTNGQFVGHMWTEAYVDGAWRTYDALDLNTDPIRIRVSTSESGEAVDERTLLRAYSFVGGMSARVVAHTPRKK